MPKPYKDPSALAMIEAKGMTNGYAELLRWYGWLDEDHVWMKFTPSSGLDTLVVWDIRHALGRVVDSDNRDPPVVSQCLGKCVEKLQAWGWDVPWAEGGET